MTAQAERRPRPSSPDKKKEQDVSPDAVKAREMFFFAGIGDLHQEIDRDYSVGRVTSVNKSVLGDSRGVTWKSVFSVNGNPLAVILEHLRDGKVWDTEYELSGTDEDGSDLYIFLEEHEGVWQSVDITKSLRKKFEEFDLDLNEDEEVVIFETVKVGDPV